MTAPHSANGLAEHLVIERSAFAVAVVIHSAVGIDTKVTSRLHRIDVRAEEQGLPAVAALLPLDHLLHTVAAVMTAGVLHAVRGDHKQRVLRAILLTGILVDVADVVNRAADGVQQRRAAARDILPFGQRLDPPDVDAVVDDLALVGEEHRRKEPPMRDISARELKGHNILAVERFWDNTRWMIEFSVLRPSTAYGSPGDEMRLFLTEDGYQTALQSQQRKEIKIKRYARVIEGHILDFKPGKRRRS